MRVGRRGQDYPPRAQPCVDSRAGVATLGTGSHFHGGVRSPRAGWSNRLVNGLVAEAGATEAALARLGSASHEASRGCGGSWVVGWGWVVGCTAVKGEARQEAPRVCGPLKKMSRREPVGCARHIASRAPKHWPRCSETRTTICTHEARRKTAGRHVTNECMVLPPVGLYDAVSLAPHASIKTCSVAHSMSSHSSISRPRA